MTEVNREPGEPRVGALRGMAGVIVGLLACLLTVVSTNLLSIGVLKSAEASVEIMDTMMPDYQSGYELSGWAVERLIHSRKIAPARAGGKLGTLAWLTHFAFSSAGYEDRAIYVPLLIVLVGGGVAFFGGKCIGWAATRVSMAGIWGCSEHERESLRRFLFASAIITASFVVVDLQLCHLWGLSWPAFLVGVSFLVPLICGLFAGEKWAR